MSNYVFHIFTVVISLIFVFGFVLLAVFRVLPTAFCVAMSVVFLIQAYYFSYVLRTDNFRCPECNEWANYEYCEYCGTEINPMFVCPGCEEKYGPKKVPDYCRKCGENLLDTEVTE